MTRSHHRLSSADGTAISIDQYPGGHPQAVIVCPGFFKSKDTPTFRRLCEALAASHDVIAMDFRGHGRSGGWYTFSAREGDDLAAVLAWARARYARLAVMGFSLGAAIAITTVSRSPDQVGSMIAVSAPCAFREIEFRWWTPQAIRSGILGLEPGAGCRPQTLWLPKPRPIDHVARLSPIPVCFIHGTRDAIIDVRHSRRLHAAAGEPKRLEIIEGGSHAEALFRDAPDRFLALAGEWFSQTLPPAVQR